MDSKTPFNKDNGTKISFSDLVEFIGATCEYKQKTPRNEGFNLCYRGGCIQTAAPLRLDSRIYPCFFRTNPSGRMMFSTSRASWNKGAISSVVKPAMPQPTRVTRNFNSGCCLANSINSST